VIGDASVALSDHLKLRERSLGEDLDENFLVGSNSALASLVESVGVLFGLLGVDWLSLGSISSENSEEEVLVVTAGVTANILLDVDVVELLVGGFHGLELGVVSRAEDFD